MNMPHPRLLVGEPILLIHTLKCTVIYGVVIVSRNLERTNENDRFKMTALKKCIHHLHTVYKVVAFEKEEFNCSFANKSGRLVIFILICFLNCRFRVMAYDHDLLSFVDVKYGDWPIVLITNPKRARYMAPKHEPVDKMKHSTHIR